MKKFFIVVAILTFISIAIGQKERLAPYADLVVLEDYTITAVVVLPAAYADAAIQVIGTLYCVPDSDISKKFVKVSDGVKSDFIIIDSVGKFTYIHPETSSQKCVLRIQYTSQDWLFVRGFTEKREGSR